jgi:hypothetical protein
MLVNDFTSATIASFFIMLKIWIALQNNIFFQFLCVTEICSLSLIYKYKSQVSENTMLRKIYLRRKNELIEHFKIVHNKEPDDVREAVMWWT